MTAKRSMTRTRYHLQEAMTSLAVVAGHLQAAKQYDPDPEASGPELYGPMLANVALLSAHAKARVIAGQPDLDRESQEDVA